MVSKSSSSSLRFGIFLLGLWLWVDPSSSFHSATTNRPDRRSRSSGRFFVVSRPDSASLPPTLEDWVILPNGRVQGIIRNHPEMEDGTVITTSPTILPPESLLLGGCQNVVPVETQSGSQYLLINPSPTMEEMRRVFDNQSNDEYYFAIPTEGMTIDQPMDGQQQQLLLQEQSLSGTKQLMQQVKDAGIAGVISYAFWELGFWAVSVPVCIAAYRQVTGHWPDFSNQEDLQQLGAEAFAFVNLARFAVPLRIGLALSTTPWVQRNLVDRFSKKKTDY